MNKKNLKEYRIWKAMKARCYCKCNRNMGNYQKDGIKVSDEWKNDFEKFMRDMGNIPGDDYSIERIDNDKNYCKENCKWIPMSEQSKNRKTVKKFSYNGEVKILKDWARFFNIKYTTLYQRIYRHNLSFEDAIKEDPFNKLIEIEGEKKTQKEWAEHFNIKSSIVSDRVHSGWDIIRALTTPKKVNKI